MEVTYVTIIAFLTFVFAEVTKRFNIDESNIPFVNIGIGTVAAVVCLTTGILPNGTAVDIIGGAMSCIISALGAGGFYDALTVKQTTKQASELKYKEAVAVYGEPEGEIEAKPETHEASEAKETDAEPEAMG